MIAKIIAIVVFVLLFIFAIYLYKNKSNISVTKSLNSSVNNSSVPTKLNPLTIQAMRLKKYPGSKIQIEKTLIDEINYHQYIASYQSDGLRIYGLLTIPKGKKPIGGWPAIIFNHGYLNPRTYQTTARYVAYVDGFAKNGYVVFKPDFRGHGSSEGKPEGAYYSPAYATDALNALQSLKKYSIPSTGSGQVVNPNKIGMWGHSMGGNITLRDLVVDLTDIKVAVIWGGVVGSYQALSTWHDPAYHPSSYELSLRYKYRKNIEKQFGSPQSNPAFWQSIDPTYFLSDITAPIQLHAGEVDEEVSVSFSQSLYDKLKSKGKTVEFYTYPGSNHNISQGFNLAMQRSVAFFDKYLK